jgi:hypothetical protein
MTKKEKAALVLERKILRAIEAGEFTPVIGYLRTVMYDPYLGRELQLGPCGCLLAGAASVCGLEGSADQETLIEYLGRHGLGRRDALLLEGGYEGYLDSELFGVQGVAKHTNPYFHVGQRLRRFHPHSGGEVG